MVKEIKIEQALYVVDENKPVVKLDNYQVVDANDNTLQLESLKHSPSEYELTLNGKKYTGEVLSLKQNVCTVVVNGNTYKFNIETEKSFSRQKFLATVNSQLSMNVSAPLPGTITSVLVDKGQKVEKGEPLMELEAMKMQNEILCPISGEVRDIKVKEGDSVLKDQILIEVK